MDQQAREQAFINALVTEHFVLQSARGAMVGEMVGRGSIYLGTVSGALIAFGFIAQSELRLAPFVAAVLPALFVLGELTFVALLRDSFQNIEFLRRIQKIRGYYRGLVPEAEEFFDPPDRDRETASEMATVGLGRGAAALLFTGASTIAAVNSILGGAGLALLLAHTIRLDEASVTAVGVLAAVLLFALHLAYEHWRGRDAGQLVAREAHPPRGADRPSSSPSSSDKRPAGTVGRPLDDQFQGGGVRRVAGGVVEGCPGSALLTNVEPGGSRGRRPGHPRDGTVCPNR